MFQHPNFRRCVSAFYGSQRRAQQTYQELSAKERLLQQQNSVREGVEKKAKQAEGDARPLPEGWKEVKDAKTGATYYWNKVGSDCIVVHAPVAIQAPRKLRSALFFKLQCCVD